MAKANDKEVMLSVRVRASLRQALKLRAIKLGIGLQELIINILQADMERKGA